MDSRQAPRTGEIVWDRLPEFQCDVQSLADETAVLACSAYVDLNPVRAGPAATPEESQYTSAYERIVADQEAHGVDVQSAKRSSTASSRLASNPRLAATERGRLGLNDSNVGHLRFNPSVRALDGRLSTHFANLECGDCVAKQ